MSALQLLVSHGLSTQTHSLRVIADISHCRDKIEAELIRVSERRTRSRTEQEYASARDAVLKRYKIMNGNEQSLPPLEDFRKLHTMQMVVHQPSTVKMLTNGSLTEPVKRELEDWMRVARKGLAKVLGFPDWKTASTTKVHIAERVNALYLCTRCQKAGGLSKWEDPGLSFKEACRHSCPHLKRKQKAKTIWDADTFVKDTHARFSPLGLKVVMLTYEQGINAVNQVLQSASIDPTDQHARLYLNTLKSSIVCHACPTPIAMEFCAVVSIQTVLSYLWIVITSI